MNLKNKTQVSPYYFEYFGDITIEKVKLMLQSNDLNQLMLFYKLMVTRDAHLFSQINKRQSQLASTPFLFKGDNKKTLDFIKSYFYEDNRIHILLQNLLSSIVYGFSVTDLVWKTENGKFIPELYHIPQTYFYSDKDGLFLNQSVQKKLYIEDNDKFLIHLHTTEASNIADLSILKKLIWSLTIKAYVIANYTQYINILGVPPVIIQHDTDNAKDIVNSVIDLRSAGVGAFPKDAVITLLEGKAPVEIFLSFIKYIDDVISQTVLGATLTNNVGQSGSYAAAKVHNEVRLDYLKLDAFLIETAVNSLIRKIHKFNFDNTDYPVFKLDALEFTDEKTRAETLQILLNMGVKIPENYIYDAFNIPVEEYTEKNSRKIDYPKLEPNTAIPLDEIDRQSDKVNFEDFEEEIYSAIQRHLEKASSYSEAISALIKAYPEMKLEKLENALMKYIANSEIYGRIEDDI